MSSKPGQLHGRPCRYCFWAKGVTPAQMLRVNSALRDKSPAEAARDRVWQLSDHAGHVQRRESVGHNDPRDGTAWSSNSWVPFIGRRS